MRIATITNWAYGATACLSVISATAMLLAAKGEDRERAAVEQRATFTQLTTVIEEDSYRLTEQARLYSVTGNPAHLVAYRRDAVNLASAEDRVAHLRDAGARSGELQALKDALSAVELLKEEQAAAIQAALRNDRETARHIMFGSEYERELHRIDHLIGQFQYMIDQRTQALVSDATRASKNLRTLSEIMLAITGLLVMFVLYFILRRRILKPVVRLSDVITRLAAQDFAVEPPLYAHVDEIGDMAEAIRLFRENGLELLRLEKARAADRAMRDLLARMTQRLHGCDNSADLAKVVTLFASEIAPAFAGSIYLMAERSGAMTRMGSWRDPEASPPEFAPVHCWALRRGQIHHPTPAHADIACPHITATERETICLPLSAQGGLIGLLYLERVDPNEDGPTIADEYLEVIMENVGLALANLHLRHQLRQIAELDPLTGLSNRRALDNALERYAATAEGDAEPFSCLMLDVDHFKSFNDQFGHDAGDAVLRAVAEILADSIREAGMAFRYGGEEFLLLMPGFGLERAKGRAEQVRERIARLEMRHDGRALGPITCSLGVATSPDHGGVSGLLNAADAALYLAKEQGRDRVAVATRRDDDAAAALAFSPRM